MTALAPLKMAHPIFPTSPVVTFAAQGSALESLFGASKTDKSDVKEWHSHFSSRFLFMDRKNISLGESFMS